ncbi:putative nuclease HARBI1 [Penaeus japonicus]|uniref:putative nuclease HARBI1 n=1 Tax=Penaeus japonicus TaxID=27405 RepID=UPI001C711DD0|nr:putative nuclease HARBI1 [Penaeus japonicus]
MPAVLGSIDCTHVAISRPPVDRPEIYRNRNGCFSINVQAVCGPALQFCNIISRWHGSAHDSYILSQSRLLQELEGGLYRGYLLGDSGYPCRTYLLTPILNPINAQERRYNTAHIKTRNPIERAFGVLKRRFSILGQHVQTEVDTTNVMVTLAAILPNIAIKQNVPMPEDAQDGHFGAIAGDPEDPDDPRPCVVLT